MERKLEDYKKVIFKKAWKFRWSFLGVKEYEDLIQDGYEVFTKLCKQEKTKPLPCPFHTALCVKIERQWLDELRSRREYLKHGAGCTFVSIDDIMLTEVNFNFERMENSLLDASDEMKVLFNLLVETPEELITLCKKFGIQDSVCKYLKKFKGWKINQLRKLKLEMSVILQGS